MKIKKKQLTETKQRIKTEQTATSTLRTSAMPKIGKQKVKKKGQATFDHVSWKEENNQRKKKRREEKQKMNYQIFWIQLFPCKERREEKFNFKILYIKVINQKWI